MEAGGGVLTKVIYEEAPPWGLTPYLLYSIFDGNDSLFVYFPLTNGSTPLTYLGCNLLKITKSCQTSISLSVTSNLTKNKNQL